MNAKWKRREESLVKAGGWGAVFSASSVWYVAGRCRPLKLCHISLTRVGPSQLLTRCLDLRGERKMWITESGGDRFIGLRRKTSELEEDGLDFRGSCLFFFFVFDVSGRGESRGRGQRSLRSPWRRVRGDGGLRGGLPGWMVAGAQNQMGCRRDVWLTWPLRKHTFQQTQIYVPKQCPAEEKHNREIKGATCPSCWSGSEVDMFAPWLPKNSYHWPVCWSLFKAFFYSFFHYLKKVESIWTECFVSCSAFVMRCF